MNYRRRISALSCLAFIVFGTSAAFGIPLSGSAYTGETGLPQRSGVIHISIKTDNTVYRVGDSPKIQVTLTNLSSQHENARAYPPWLLCKLSVALDGRELAQPSTGWPGGFWDLAMFYRMGPGASIVTGYTNYGQKAVWTGWVPIEAWGYKLTAPGQYVISAIPDVVVSEPTTAGTSQFRTAASDRSNSVRVQVTR